MKLKVKIDLLIQKIIDKVTGNGVMQEENTVQGERFIYPNMPELIRKAGAEGAVLLKNNKVLPIKDEAVSVFGRCQRDYFYVGYGSGGDVNQPYEVNLIDGLKNNGVNVNTELADIYEDWCQKNPVLHGWWGHWPMNYPEMKLNNDIVKNARAKSEVAVVVIGRAAGEDRENKLTKGSYYLTDVEINMLDLVTASFEKVVVIMDCGNIVDMSWTQKYGDKLGAIIYAWQCGMESGNALADVITGAVNPSGKLTDTIAINYEDYPSASHFGGKDYNDYSEDIYVGYRYFESFDKDRVLYPFGYGLSYTDFDITCDSFSAGDKVNISVKVKNIGDVEGKEVVQIYVNAPKGKMSKAKRSLVAFEKTKSLAPNEEQVLSFEIDKYSFSSYDEEGAAYVIEKGNYEFYVGNNVRTAQKFGEAEYDDEVIEKLSNVCPLKEPIVLLTGELVKPKEDNLKMRILSNLPKEIGYNESAKYHFDDVKSGKVSVDDFISQLTEYELEGLSRGIGYMNSEHGVIGNAGSFAGTTNALLELGVPPIITTDGPAGIRIGKYTSLIPCGTALACTWNTALVEELSSLMGEELSYHKSDVLLAPGMNIHRNVLCGRNFEYFSEDPVVSGKMAAAFVRGIQSGGGSACPKHFACNNQEVSRTKTDTRITERALREIYLKGFEICVKEAKPLTIMTSYNKINGVWSHYNYDLVTTVLRGEWGYDSCVITDWWMQRSASPEFPIIKDNAYRVRAQVDVLMPGGEHTDKKYKSDGTLLDTLYQPDGITRAELERTAKNVLNLCLKLNK